jgi:CheY-like chemotaxis protein
MTKKILLIDDSEPDNFLHTFFLKKHSEDLDLTSVLNVEKAVELLTELRDNYEAFPDIILLDINMPRLNGWDFLDIVYTSKKYPIENTKFYMLTTSINPDDKDTALNKYKLNGFFNKPLNQEHIKEILGL